MKLTIDKTTFSDAVAFVARTIPGRPANPILAGVVLHAADGRLALSAFDYETSATTTVTADVATEGRAIVSGRLLAEIAKSLPNKPVTLETDGALIHVRCGTSKFRLLTMPLDEFPALPSATTALGTITGHALEHAVSQVAVAVSRDETLTHLTGVLVEATPGLLTLMATDRYRLAIRDLAWDGTVEETFIVRGKVMSEASKQLQGDVHVTTNAHGTVGFSDGTRTLTTQLVDGDYPPVRRLFPDAVAVKATVNVADLAAAVKRVALVADRGIPVRLVFADDTVTVMAGQGDDATASEALDATIDGDPLTGNTTTLAFNPQYLADALGALDAQHVQFGANHQAKPVTLLPVGTDGETVDGYRHLLVPIRFQG